jgi:hypothetical protein
MLTIGLHPMLTLPPELLGLSRIRSPVLTWAAALSSGPRLLLVLLLRPCASPVRMVRLLSARLAVLGRSGAGLGASFLWPLASRRSTTTGMAA